MVVFVQVTLATHSPKNSERFQRLINGLEEVQEAEKRLTGLRLQYVSAKAEEQAVV